MKQNNERNSRKRLNSLILLVAFTAIMLIVSTYAWFSINNEVSITNLRGTVEVVEGLQISLDASNWSDSLNLSELNIISDGYAGNSNISPTELLPVSTTGVAGASAKELKMYRGTNVNKIQLNDIVETVATGTTAEANPDTYPGYIAFDVFLMNTGTTQIGDEVVTSETLQLNTESSIKIIESGNEEAGLQNTIRVGFALFSGQAEPTDSTTNILAKTNDAGSYISDVAIWEPNANAHIEKIVRNNNLLILDNATATPWGLQVNSSGYYPFTATTALPTYALTDSASGSTITNIYDWKATPTEVADAGKLAMQNTVQTISTEDDTIGNVYNLKSTSKTETTGADVEYLADFEIPANKIVKLRIYVWLEGQDVDCTNYASHGGGVDVNIGLVKGEASENPEPTN